MRLPLRPMYVTKSVYAIRVAVNAMASLPVFLSSIDPKLLDEASAIVESDLIQPCVTVDFHK